MSSERSASNINSIATDSHASAIAPVVPRHGWYLPIKAVVEWIAALVFLVLLIPVLLLLAVLVRLTSAGPAFYSQSRVGRGGRIFLMHKLRTMRQDSEAKTGPVWSSTTDSRVTRIGRVLRSTHLDELPQLLTCICSAASPVRSFPRIAKVSTWR
jgi:lipopolysaccharide/colanic/teichoic acid biosynthesis glycosyltransferase